MLLLVRLLLLLLACVIRCCEYHTPNDLSAVFVGDTLFVWDYVGHFEFYSFNRSYSQLTFFNIYKMYLVYRFFEEDYFFPR